MSENMIQRVARAMCLHDHGYDIWDDQAEMVREQYRLRIRAAIEAMRVPTDQMALVDTDPEGATLIWQRMIDEALR